ncbi:hypothetical protein ZOSMA_85G00210 [Zostera marina]|uniref:BHLH domain-containing protein n=1 Tax=Zostera marina TaxID=29655 RepID=A0A0K9NL02_ZOSMR|nr:hypothetical protein ZOSMA_85G00210 [Zostera marina]
MVSGDNTTGPENSDDSRSLPDRKSQIKVPRKIHKAEREKLKRDHLNDLFFKLGHVVEPTRQNNGKASILGEATKLLRDLVVQVESLKRENVTLLSESRYVTQEKNELKDETIVLMSEIEKMRSAQSQSHEQQPMYVISPTSQDTHVRRPHPRRATPLDPWQHRILTRATELTGEEEEEEEREQAGKMSRELQLLD